MGRVSLNDISKYQEGGAFFKIEDGEKKTVRFLYNTVEEVVDSALLVHEYSGANFATIDCCRGDGEPLDTCKWCASGNKPVLRVVVPIYDVMDNTIKYWKRSGSFVKDNLLPLFENLPSNAPISGQCFILGRTGKDMTNTKYTVAPDMRMPNDGKTKDQFGDIKDPFEMNMIRPNDTDFNVNATAQNNVQQNGFAPTRNRAEGIF